MKLQLKSIDEGLTTTSRFGTAEVNLFLAGPDVLTLARPFFQGRPATPAFCSRRSVSWKRFVAYFHWYPVLLQ